MLDPDLHTMDYVRNRSALLTTTVLAIGSTALGLLNPEQDGQVAESLRLHAHVEKLGLVVFSTGARSIEIVQAQIVSQIRCWTGLLLIDSSSSCFADGELHRKLDSMSKDGSAPACSQEWQPKSVLLFDENSTTLTRLIRKGQTS